MTLPPLQSSQQQQDTSLFALSSSSDRRTAATQPAALGLGPVTSQSRRTGHSSISTTISSSRDGSRSGPLPGHHLRSTSSVSEVDKPDSSSAAKPEKAWNGWNTFDILRRAPAETASSSSESGRGAEHTESRAYASGAPSAASRKDTLPHAIEQPLRSAPRSKANTPLTQLSLASSAAGSTTASQGGGGGGGSSGGGLARTSTFSPAVTQPNPSSPSSPSFILNNSNSSPSGANNIQAGQLSKIVVAQVFLLLSSIKEDKDKAKWELQAEQIRKLIDSNGMEVFSRYFKRLLVGNASQIFPGINKPIENPANYPLLVEEVRKITVDPAQARKIADAIATPDGDIFRDFDLSTFMDHFKLDPLEKTILALGFKTSARADLRTKADAILSNNFQRFLEAFALTSNQTDRKHSDLPSSIVTGFIDTLLQHPPPNLNEEGRARLDRAARLRYINQGLPIPVDVIMVLQLNELLTPRQPLIRAIQRAGPQATSNLESCREVLHSAGNASIEPSNIAGALLFMLSTVAWQQYSPAILVTCIREHAQSARLEWAQVLREFDRDGLKIDSERFLILFNALLPVALDNSDFDIQSLWGGRWHNQTTQLSFILAFIGLDSSRLDASTIPQLRPTFNLSDFADAPEKVQEDAARAYKHPLISLDVTLTLASFMSSGQEFFGTAEGQQLQEIVQANADIFLCSAMRAPKPWSDTQQGIFAGLFYQFLQKRHANYAFVLSCLWHQDKQWVAMRLVEAHAQDHLKLPLLLDHAQEHRWLDDLFMILNGFGIDLAALAHRRGVLDIEQWAQTNAQRGSSEFAFALLRFLTIKAEDEMKNAREDDSPSRMVSLAVKTVHAMLEILEEELGGQRRDELITVQRLCIQAYPRLINYGEGFDDIIDKSGDESNSISEAADAMMQEHYKRMYSGERDVRDVVGALKNYKQSRDPAEQDLFACMIHGLFDEYSCYHEYPLEALATTAVLFGGIINFNLISGIPLRVGLGMILEAVRDYSPETSMYKFGLQALLHFFNRLQEWPGFCSFLLQVPGLQGTEAFTKAEEVVKDSANHLSRERETNGVHHEHGFSETGALTNGTIDEMFPTDISTFHFTSIHSDPPSGSDFYEDPDEDTQDKVLFVLNNVSEQNLETKLKDLKDALDDKHHQWFAGYLVEERAKMQPNFHKLYLDMLDLFEKKSLWSEVLRETYVSVVRMLNAQSTMESSTERAHLKNLATWLGSLTIARDKPILHKNISFEDLLIEAYDTQRLTIAIPFTCRVLAQASKSTVFKPPSAWIMHILRLLVELYHYAELKLQMKFEIEVLCTDLQLDHNAIEPSTGLRERPHLEETMSGPTLPDGLDAFDDLSITGLARSGARNERFSPGAITSALPDIGSLLVYPPTSNTTINRESLRYIVENAVRKAIQEIISPVVERSVTIAAISTAQLIHKDFAMESNEDRVRQSALTMVKALAGSLALVTCKEPLRMSMTNYIRVLSVEVGDQALPEGAILMCVNDNLDVACSMVESAAEQRSMPEIEENIEQQLIARRRHRAARPNEPFVDPIINRWSFYIPEPYKQSPNGLNKEQMAIYEEFARQSRGPSSTTIAPSADSVRQVTNDVLQDSYAAVPNLPTPSETATIPQDNHHQQRMQPTPTAVTHIPQNLHLNGYPEHRASIDRIEDFLTELQRTLHDTTEEHVKDLSNTSPVVEIIDQILRFVMISPQQEDQAFMGSKLICQMLYTQLEQPLEIEVYAQLLKRLCDLSPVTAREVTIWLGTQDVDRSLNVPVTLNLLDVGLLELHQVDLLASRAMEQRKAAALDFLSSLMDELLFNDKPVALRADFAMSLEAMGRWLLAVPDLTVANRLVRKLREAGVAETIDASTDDETRQRRDQLEYTFAEWVRLCSRPNASDKTYAAFIYQLHQKKILADQGDSCMFFRLCIDASVEAFERVESNPGGLLADAYAYIDALAKLVVLLVHYQSELDGASKRSKASYLNSILSLITLVLNFHHVMRGEQFNQKVFFRLFSTILCEQHAIGRQSQEEHREMMQVYANTFLNLKPSHFPGFTFGWLALISHRFFMPSMLLLAEQAGWSTYALIMEAMLSYVGELLKSLTIPRNVKGIYRGTLRILLLLHHDFPEFLAENHNRLCGAIPAHCTQLRNLILSAYPSSFSDLPDPFTAGLKVDRINEIRSPPAIAGDFEGPMRKANIKETVDAALSGPVTEEQVYKITQAVVTPIKKETGISFAPINADLALLNSLVLYIGQSAIGSVGQKGGPTFVPTSPQADLLIKLVHALHPEARYYFLSAIANQLRYPNSHTHYFSYALLFLFGNDHNDQQESDVRQQITRVLLERLIVHRPHPWGLIITLLELLKNPSYMFWDLPFIKAAPEIERLFGALFQHINQSPR